MGCLILSRAFRQSPICRHCRKNTSTCLHLSTCSHGTKKVAQHKHNTDHVKQRDLQWQLEVWGVWSCEFQLVAAVAAARAPGKKKSPPVTVVNKTETSSGKRVMNYSTLAAAHAPTKTPVIPAVPALAVAPAPFVEEKHML